MASAAVTRCRPRLLSCLSDLAALLREGDPFAIVFNFELARIEPIYTCRAQLLHLPTRL